MMIKIQSCWKPISWSVDEGREVNTRDWEESGPPRKLRECGFTQGKVRVFQEWPND